MSAFREKFPNKTVIEAHYEIVQKGGKFRGLATEELNDNSRFLYEDFFEKFCQAQNIDTSLLD